MKSTRTYMIHPELPVTFGKWKGKLWKEVFMFDNHYFNWVIRDIEQISVFTTLFEDIYFIDVFSTGMLLTGLERKDIIKCVLNKWCVIFMTTEANQIQTKYIHSSIDEVILMCQVVEKQLDREYHVAPILNLHQDKLSYIFQFKKRFLNSYSAFCSNQRAEYINKREQCVGLNFCKMKFSEDFVKQKGKIISQISQDNDDYDDWDRKYTENDLLNDAFEGDWDNAWNID